MLTFKFILDIIKKVRELIMDILNKPRKQKRMADGLKEGLEQAVEISEAQLSFDLGDAGITDDSVLLKVEMPHIEMTHVALGTFKDSSGQWNLVKIQYNPEAGVVGEFTSTIEGERYSAIDRFKIEAINNKII